MGLHLNAGCNARSSLHAHARMMNRRGIHTLTHAHARAHTHLVAPSCRPLADVMKSIPYPAKASEPSVARPSPPLTGTGLAVDIHRWMPRHAPWLYVINPAPRDRRHHVASATLCGRLHRSSHGVCVAGAISSGCMFGIIECCLGRRTRWCCVRPAMAEMCGPEERHPSARASLLR